MPWKTLKQAGEPVMSRSAFICLKWQFILFVLEHNCIKHPRETYLEPLQIKCLQNMIYKFLVRGHICIQQALGPLHNNE